MPRHYDFRANKDSFQESLKLPFQVYLEEEAEDVLEQELNELEENEEWCIFCGCNKGIMDDECPTCGC